jgi:molecular chaperone GrpE (heat shock protein)
VVFTLGSEAMTPHRAYDPNEIAAALLPLTEALERAVQALPVLENLPDIRLMRLTTRAMKLRVDVGNYRLRMQREAQRAGR